MKTFKREWFPSTTDYVKANYLVGNNPIIETQFGEVRVDDGSRYVTSLKFNDKTSNFSKMKLTQYQNAGAYTFYSCFNDIEELDCSKFEIATNRTEYVRFFDGYYSAMPNKNRVIKNLDYKNLPYQYNMLIFGLSKLEVLENIGVYNAYFSLGDDIGSMKSIRKMTFKDDCDFLGVYFRKVTIQSREALVNLLNALQPVTTTHQCVIGSQNIALLTDEDKKIATGKGWTLA